MRDLVAGIVAILLLVAAVRLLATLHGHRRRRERGREAEQALGRTIIAELPTSGDLTLFSEDDTRFYWGGRSVDKDQIVAVRVLVNGSPIAASVSSRRGSHPAGQPASVEDRPEGIAYDRWDVAVETVSDTTLIACGAIRERVSQELARAVFEAVRNDLERRDATTRFQPRSRHD